MAVRSISANLSSVLFSLCLLCNSIVFGSGTHTTRFNSEVPVGLEVLQYPDGCIVLISTLTSPDFFEGLEKVESSTGVFFRKNNRTVTTFPPKIYMQVRARPDPCGKNGDVSLLSLETHEKLKSLRLEVFWKNGVETRPAQFESSIRENSLLTEDRPSFTIVVQVDSKDVDIRNSLVLVINNPDGKQRLRMSARL